MRLAGVCQIIDLNFLLYLEDFNRRQNTDFIAILIASIIIHRQKGNFTFMAAENRSIINLYRQSTSIAGSRSIPGQSNELITLVAGRGIVRDATNGNG